MDSEDKATIRRFSVSAAGWVAIILAIGLVVALNIVVVAIMWAASQRLGIDPDSGISENATQLLSGTFSGIISLLAGYLGYTVGKKVSTNGTDKPPEPPTPAPPGTAERL